MSTDASRDIPANLEIMVLYQRLSPAMQAHFLDFVRRAAAIPDTPERALEFERLCADARREADAIREGGATS